MSRPKRPSLLNSVLTQVRVLSALIVREALARCGHANIGFFWVLVEPLLFATGVFVLWSMSPHNNAQSVGLVIFVLTGYCCVTLWRHVAGRSVRALRHRADLLYHINVKPLDLLLAIILLETVAIFTAFILAFIVLWTFDIVQPVNDPIRLIGGFLTYAWFSGGFAMILAGLSERYDSMEKIIPPAMYLTLPLTGVFSLVAWLPQKAQDFLLYSPAVHSMEMLRSAVLSPDVKTYYSVPYIIGSCIFVTVVGLLVMQNVQKHLGS